ncbi:hypothetical protein RZS28_15675 [Methylocapsa polymorpha]|uniref:Uncharacterized protein n=1 Tax=Methylocapsa polymorpha TaxID=3080828 RepID=A0ABZ0HR28_9HYPH|nr:hypothetical protein RZS28_15675 [Methylocapsa sp. RX1]
MRVLIVFSIAISVSLCADPGFLSVAVAVDATQRDAVGPAADAFGGGDSPANLGGASDSWRRVHGPDSNGGTEAAAILHTAEFERSDPRLAGLMLRCGDHGVEVIIVVVEPFPPHARPKITLRVAGQESYFEGIVIPTGAGVRVPVDAWKLATGSQLGSKELGVKISDGESMIDGVVALAGLRPALESLSVDCARK